MLPAEYAERGLCNGGASSTNYESVIGLLAGRVLGFAPPPNVPLLVGDPGPI